MENEAQVVERLLDPPEVMRQLQACVLERIAGNEHAEDFVGPFEDGHDARVTQVALIVVLFRVAHPAVDLQTFVRRVPSRLRAEHLQSSSSSKKTETLPVVGVRPYFRGAEFL